MHVETFGGTITEKDIKLLMAYRTDLCEQYQFRKTGEILEGLKQKRLWIIMSVGLVIYL